MPYLIIGCFSQLENSLYTTFAPLVFNFGLMLILLPALIETNYNPRNYLSIRYFFLSDLWRPLYKLSLEAYIV